MADDAGDSFIGRWSRRKQAARHGRPEEERLADLKRFLAMRGLHFEMSGELEPKQLQRLLAPNL